MSTRNQDTAQGRFFRTLVVMGGTLALGCGGVAQESTEDEPGTGGTPNSGGGLTATGGVGAATGGAATGGLTSTGGVFGAGGYGGLPSYTPGPFTCPPEQWDCAVEVSGCEYTDFDFGLVLPNQEECLCDATKPKSEADCQVGETFVCGRAVTDKQGRAFASVPFNCACVPAPTDCHSACTTANEASSHCDQYWEDPTLAPLKIECDCAYPVLK